MDKVTKEKRSEIMSKVRSVNSEAEMRVRRRLHAKGYRFKLHDKGLAGKPDIVLPKYRAVVFVHGCFWHRHNCKQATMPASNIDYWKAKFARNVARFKEVKRELRRQGWRVLVIWECQAKTDEQVGEWLAHSFKPYK
jgi:DNA mismatch endonuclease (patch repair protein)